MANQSEDRRADARRRRERQYEIDRLTAQYANEYRAGRAPQVEEYIRRRPEFAQELLEFTVYFHTIGADTEALDAPTESRLSTAGQRVLKQIQQSHADTSPAGATVADTAEVTELASAGAPLDGLVKQGARVGYTPRALAEAVGLTTNLLGKLEARAIAAASIPPTLVRRLATALKVAPEAVTTYLGLSASQTSQAGAFYYADQQPTQQQEAFLDAVQNSALSPESKRTWGKIVAQDAAT